MRNPVLIIFSFFLFAVIKLNGQSVANYSVTRTTGNSYVSIASTGSAVPSWRNNGAFSQDDNRSSFIEIGFDFWYNGVRYTELSVSTNGFIDFSNSTDDGGPQGDDFGYINSAFTTSAINNATRPAIAPFYDDMTAQGGTDPLGNSIRYLLSGTAPNRVFTVEWINMAVYQNTSPSLNFQVKLYETSGIIEMNYGTMTQGTHGFSYTCGINAPTMNLVPNATQLFSQQTANTATFNNGVQNNLNQMPLNGSRLVFNPPVPANPAGVLSFTAVQQTSMTVNWSNWATNEVGYVIYYSYDGGIEYFFGGQTAANATNFNLTGLFPGTVYQFRVYAVTEGRLSNSLTGSQSTLAAGNKVSTGNGNWSQNNSWLPAGVPTAGDNVTILNNHTITLNTDGVCNNLTIGSGSSGTLAIGNNNTARTLTVNGNITTVAGGIFRVNTTSNTTHKIDLKGKIQNNGTIDFRPDANSLCDVGFNNNQSQAIAGTGTLARFNDLILNIGSGANKRLDVTAINLDFPNDFLVLTNGTFHYNSTQASTFVVSTADYNIQSGTGIWLDGNATLNFQNNLQLDGNLRVSRGFLTVGNAANEDLNSNGGNFSIDGGAVSVAGNYYNTNINTISNFTISSGSLTVPTVGSTSTTEAPFTITSPGASFNMTGGSIIIQREGGNGTTNLGYLVNNISFSSVTGGTLQIGNTSTPVGSTMEINSTVPIGNLLVNNANATAQLEVNPLTVIQDVTINSGALNANNLNLTFGRNWLNTATFTAGNATVTYNGSGASTITHSTSETFNNLTVSGTGSLTTNSNLLINGNLTINSTFDVSAANRTINLRRNWINNGVFIPREGMVNMSGTVLQNMSGTSASNFFDLTINNNSGVTILNGNYSIEDALFLSAGLFNVNAATLITLQSNATRTARIAPVVAGTLSGNFRVERFIGNRSAGFSDLASPVIASTFGDWGNELLLIYGNNPPYVYPSSYSYSESLWDFVPVTNAATTLTPGKGFEVWLDTYGDYSVFEADVINTVGQPVIGTVNLSSTITRVNDGWNLIGNPYASYVSWDAVRASSSQIGGTIMMYDETINDYQTFNLANGVEIAPHQGFWVEATGNSPVFSFNESHKTTSTNSNFRSMEESFVLRLSGLSLKGNFTSNAKFEFADDAKEFADDQDISFKKVPHPLAPVLCSKMNDEFLRVNYLPNDLSNLIIPMHYQVGESGKYKINAINVSQLQALGFTCAVLIDQKTKNKIDLFSNEEYEFEAAITDEENRFVLVLSKNNACDVLFEEETLVDFYQTENGIVVQLSYDAEHSGTIKLYNAIGQEMDHSTNILPGNRELIVFPTTSGIYHLIVEVNGKFYSKKFFAE